MKKTIAKLLKDAEIYHSEFQIDNFIIGKQGNAWAQYKQCLREIASRHDKMIELKESRKVQKETLKRLRYKSERIAAGLIGVDNSLSRSERSYKRTLQDMKHTTRELFYFVRIAEGLKQNLGEITKEKRRQLEAQMWFEKAAFMIELDLKTAGAVSRQTVEMVEALPGDMKRRLLEGAKRLQIVSEAKQC